MSFKLVACGGTFDHFHKGHREFLKQAFLVGKKVLIGLTSDDFMRLKKGDQGEPYEKREQALRDFLKKEGLEKLAEIIQIHDVFGPTLSSSFPIEAIVVSWETQKGALLINKKRKELSLPLLKIIVIKLALAEDGKTISSLRIRKGEINREGRLFVHPAWFTGSLFLPEKMRPKLKAPFGPLITDLKKWQEEDKKLNLSNIITVGDAVTKSFNTNRLGPKIAIVDWKVARKKTFKSLSELGFSGHELVLQTVNPPGMLKPELFKTVQKAFGLVPLKPQIVIQVEGEEDLAVLPCLLVAPLGFTVFYGQPGVGFVRVSVTEENKERAYSYVTSFTRGY